ncbi:MAG: HD domain-containing protein [Gammaproteobacteria bacterium]|nr:HD domain-containing protein [Gammaproteobacteria bacterium]
MSDSTAGTARPNYEKAIEYALDRLRGELPATLHYHCAWHTEGDVLPAARRLGQLAGVSPSEQGLINVGAAYHDVGHIHVSYGHEAISIKIMAEVLPRFGFSSQDIERVASLIMATRMPQSPKNELERLLADADMDGLGRTDFLVTSKALWQENMAYGKIQSWPQWLETQVRFLRAHRYFTSVARTLREEGKQQNIAMLEELIQNAHKE